MKKILLSAFCLLAFSAFTAVSAQTTGYLSFPEPNHNNSYTRMIHTSDGGFLSVGTGGLAGANHDITKYNSNFQVQWYKNFASAAVLYWNDIIETNDGKYIVMGANQNHTGCNVVMKLTSTGTILWQREYYVANSFLTSFALSKAAGNDPGFVFGGGACAASNFLIRCDANGDIVWQHEYYILGGSGVETILSINAESDHYIISGYMGVSSDIDAYTMKVDSASTFVWCNVASEPVHPQVPFKTIKLSTGGYAMLCGYNSNPNYSQLIYYFNASGIMTNAVKLTSPTQEEINFGGLVEISNGRIMLNGSVNASPMSYLYMELAANGTIVWQKKGVGVTPGFLNGTGSTIAKTSNNLYALGGGAYTDGKTVAVIDSTGTGFCNGVTSSVSSVAGDAYTMTVPNVINIAPNVLDTVVSYTSGALTITQSTLCGTLGVNENVLDASAVNVYPNPAQNEITLDFGDLTLTKAEVTFYNMLGENVSDVVIRNGNSNTVDISNLASGIYMMEVLVDGQKMVKRVIKN